MLDVHADKEFNFKIMNTWFFVCLCSLLETKASQPLLYKIISNSHHPGGKLPGDLVTILCRICLALYQAALEFTLM